MGQSLLILDKAAVIKLDSLVLGYRYWKIEQSIVFAVKDLITK